MGPLLPSPLCPAPAVPDLPRQNKKTNSNKREMLKWKLGWLRTVMGHVSKWKGKTAGKDLCVISFWYRKNIFILSKLFLQEKIQSDNGSFSAVSPMSNCCHLSWPRLCPTHIPSPWDAQGNQGARLDGVLGRPGRAGDLHPHLLPLRGDSAYLRGSLLALPPLWRACWAGNGGGGRVQDGLDGQPPCHLPQPGGTGGQAAPGSDQPGSEKKEGDYWGGDSEAWFSDPQVQQVQDGDKLGTQTREWEREQGENCSTRVKARIFVGDWIWCQEEEVQGKIWQGGEKSKQRVSKICS